MLYPVRRHWTSLFRDLFVKGAVRAFIGGGGGEQEVYSYIIQRGSTRPSSLEKGLISKEISRAECEDINIPPINA